MDEHHKFGLHCPKFMNEASVPSDTIPRRRLEEDNIAIAHSCHNTIKAGI